MVVLGTVLILYLYKLKDPGLKTSGIPDITQLTPLVEKGTFRDKEHFRPS